MVLLAAAELAWDKVGKGLLRDMVYGENPGRVTNNGTRFLINMLSDDYELELALQDIAVLKEQVAALSDAVVSIDKKLEWSLYAAALQHPIHEIMTRWDDFETFCSDMAAGGFDAATRRAKMPVSLHNQCQGFDEIATLMHQAIMGLDEDGHAARKQQFFRAYEAYHPHQVNFGNPRAYFEARLKVFQHFASYQVQAVSMAVAYYRAEAEIERGKGNDYAGGHNDRKAEETEANLVSALSEQYQLMLLNMPNMAKAAVAGRNALSFTQSTLAIAKSPDRDVKDPIWEKAVPQPSLPYGNFMLGDGEMADLSAQAWSDLKWRFTYMGEDDTGFHFSVVLGGKFLGRAGGWNLTFSDEVPLPKGMTARHAGDTDTFLRLGQHLYGADVDLSDLPAAVRGILEPIQREGRATTQDTYGQPLVLTLALMSPNTRDRVDFRAADGSLPADVFDHHFAMRVAPMNASGHAGKTLHKRRNSAHGEPDAIIPRPAKTTLTKALPNAIDWDGALYLPDEIDVSPAPVTEAKVARWVQPQGIYDAVARAAKTEHSPKRVRYYILSENCVEVCRLMSSVDCGPGALNLADDYVVLYQSGMEFAYPVISFKRDNNWTTSIRLLRQFEGESELREVEHYEVLDEYGENGDEIHIADKGGVIYA